MNLRHNSHQRRFCDRVWLLVILIWSSLFISPSALAQILQIGSEGIEVTRVQQRLRDLGYFNQAPTSFYGEDTEAAVRAFQRAYNLTPDGRVGDVTRSVLFNRTFPTSSLPPVGVRRNLPVPTAPATTNTNLTEAQVRQVQQRLSDLGYNPGLIDGIYGDQTTAAVSAFQRNNGLQVDGVAGSQTLPVLFSNRAVVARQNRNERSEGRSYVVVIPNPDLNTLNNDLDTIREAFANLNPRIETSRRGQYIWAGAFANYEAAEARTYLLRDLGFDARVVYF